MSSLIRKVNFPSDLCYLGSSLFKMNTNQSSEKEKEHFSLCYTGIELRSDYGRRKDIFLTGNWSKSHMNPEFGLLCLRGIDKDGILF